LHLKDDAGLVTRARSTTIVQSNVAIGGGGHECKLDATAYILLVGLPKLSRQYTTCSPAKYPLCALRSGELNDGRIEGVERRAKGEVSLVHLKVGVLLLVVIERCTWPAEVKVHTAIAKQIVVPNVHRA